MIKSIIFDFDGVIHDTFDIGYSLNKKIDPTFTVDDFRSIFMGNLYEHKKISVDARKKFFDMAPDAYKGLIIEKEIKEELIKLKNKFKLFIVTSNSESILKSYFDENSLNNLFIDILGVETHTSKEHKFNIILKKHNLTKNDCIFITDTLGDILEANKLGIKTIAVDYGFHERKILEKGNPSMIISDFKEINRLVNH